jgi:transposase
MATAVNMEARNSISVLEQRTILKVFFLEGNSGAEAHRRLVRIMGTNALSNSAVKFWFARFAEGNWDTTETRGRDHRPSDFTEERIEAVENALDESRAWSLRSLSAKLDIPRSTLHGIIKEKLKFRKVNAKWVPYELSPAQMETRVAYCTLNLKNYRQQTTRLTHTISIDETWISFYRPPEKDQTKEWRRPGEKKTNVALPNTLGPKRMLVLAMDYDGICYYEILEEKEKMDQHRYLQFLKNLMAARRDNRKHQVWLLDDNARPHRTTIINDWIRSQNIQRWLQPAYSPDLSPCDYGCCHALKRAIGGVHYATVAEIRRALDNEITEGNGNGKYQAVRKLPERWGECIALEGGYL